MFNNTGQPLWYNLNLDCGFVPKGPQMHEEDKMAPRLSANEIRGLGFDWPKYALIEEHSVMEGGKVDLVSTIEGMQSSRAFYQGQLNAAFAFKTQTGADYSDFTDRFDEYARMHRDLGVVIAYLEEIVAAASGPVA